VLVDQFGNLCSKYTVVFLEKEIGCTSKIDAENEDGSADLPGIHLNVN